MTAALTPLSLLASLSTLMNKIPCNAATIWLVIWMANNIGVTLLNKAAFATVKFHYPYALSAVHMWCNYVGSLLVFWLAGVSSNNNANSTCSSGGGGGNTVLPLKKSSTPYGTHRFHKYRHAVQQVCLGNDFERKTLDTHGQRMIWAFSVIFSLNIAIGNVSLSYVSVNFNQVMRSLVPAVTIAMGKYCLGKTFSRRRQLAVLPVVIGVAMATFGDLSFTALGFIYTVACVLLAALKVVASGEMLTGSLKLHPVDLLGHMAPLALLQCLVLSILTGEMSDLLARWSVDLGPSSPAGWYPVTVVLWSGVLSFSLNLCSLQANKLTSPLTLCIAANVKQVLMIAASTVIFGIEISPLNGAGIIVVLAGSARYSYVSVLEQQQAKKDKQLTPKSTVSMGADDDDDTDRATKDSEMTGLLSSLEQQAPSSQRSNGSNSQSRNHAHGRDVEAPLASSSQGMNMMLSSSGSPQQRRPVVSSSAVPSRNQDLTPPMQQSQQQQHQHR